MKFFFSNNDADVVPASSPEKSQFTNEVELIKVISHELTKIINANNASFTDKNVTVYHSSTPPSISIERYLYRFRFKGYTKLPINIYLAMFIYLDNYFANDPTNTKKLTILNVHRLLASCILLAYKFHEDYPPSNPVMAKASGMPVKELNRLEWDFFMQMNLKLTITIEELEDCQKKLLSCAN